MKNNIPCPVCGKKEYKIKRKRQPYYFGYCSFCYLAYVKPLPVSSDFHVKVKSTKTADKYNRGSIENFDAFVAAAHIKAPKMLQYWTNLIESTPVRILDIGCGLGTYYFAFKNLGVEWEGIDINPQLVNFALQKRVNIKLRDIMQMKGKGLYDVIFCSQVLEHILEPNRFMQKMRSLLSNWGIIHLDVPNHNSLISFYRKLNFLHSQYGFLQPDHHMIAYSKISLKKILLSNGFKICHLQTYSNNHPLMGQLLPKNYFINKFFYSFSQFLNKGSLLVAIAKK